MYSSEEYFCVRGVFLPQLINELTARGRNCFLDDPHGALWAVLDRASMEVERVVLRLKDSGGRERQGEEGRERDEMSMVQGGCESMKYFLICLKAMQPELYRVTPIYALCGMLKKGVAAISAIAEEGENTGGKGETERTEREGIDDIHCDLFNWVSTTLSVLQNRLSGPISRDDWTDFVSAGGLDSLCVLLTSPLFSGMSGVKGMVKGTVKETVKATADGTDISNHIESTQMTMMTGRKERDRAVRGVRTERGDELLVLSAQLLQNLVLSSRSKYAMVRETNQPTACYYSILSCRMLNLSIIFFS